MKTLRQVINELQEFGEKNNALELECYSTYGEQNSNETAVIECLQDINPAIIKNINDYGNTRGVKGPIVVL
jgi:hypothetical protein